MLSEVLLSLGLFGVLFLGITVWHYFQWYFLFRRRARLEVKCIAQAIRNYVEKYGRTPVVDPAREEQPAGRVIEVLRGYNHGAICIRDEIRGGINPEHIDFLAPLVPEKAPHALWGARDPWGKDIHIAIDRNQDGKTEIGFQDDQTFANVSPIRVLQRSTRAITITVDSPLAVWSDGPNRRNECGYGDDICSWMLGLPPSLRDRSKGRPL